ncbi:MAG TPA: lysophospholipid acyltransferase family protein [bacterium]|nr:lysophospholipid acyltransferase family protein [bacterium]
MSAVREARLTLEWIAFLGLGGLVRALPRGAALFLGTAMAAFAFDILRIRRHVAIENIEKHLPPPGKGEAVRIARRSYAVIARTFVDIFQAPKVTNQEMWKLISRKDVESVAQVVAQHQGAILVSAHFGNWELLIHSFSRVYPKVRVIVGDQSNRRVDAAVKEVRKRGGVPAISSRKGIREAVHFLREGGAVGTLMDQDARKRGIFVDFLGAPAATYTGMIALALHAGVPFIPVLLVDRGKTYSIEIAPAWKPREGASEEENLRMGALHYNRFLEEQVRRHPENYFWAHRRWKTRPS